MAQALRSSAAQNEAAELIQCHAALSNQQRIEIYQDSINAIYINTLKETYPVCLRLVGDEFFSAMCFRYLKDAQSRSPDLNDCGEDFPAFIADFPPAQQLPYLADVARLEWLWHRLSFAEKNTNVDLAALQTLSEDELATVEFSIPIDAQTTISGYPIKAIWDSNTVFPDEGNEINLNCGGVQLILYRNYSGKNMDDVKPEVFCMLQLCANTITFAELAKRYLATEFADEFSAVFAICCTQGWLIKNNRNCSANSGNAHMLPISPEQFIFKCSNTCVCSALKINCSCDLD